MYSDDSGQISELNPRPIRLIQTMGDVTMRDWVIFIIFGGATLIVWMIVNNLGIPKALFPNDEANMQQIWGLVMCLPIAGVGALFAFIQSPTNGKLRTRFWRGAVFLFQKKYFEPHELVSLYSIKETRENHVHYRSEGSEGVFSVYRINGYDPSLLEQGKFQGLIESLTQFFSVNIRFKIYSTRVGFHIPPKDIKLDIDHYGVNYAKNRYYDRIDDLNNNADLKQTSYFLIIDGPSIEKNMQTFDIIASPLGGAHLIIEPASKELLSQVLNDIWCNTFDFASPAVRNVKAIEFDKVSSIWHKKDGTHEYMRIVSFNGIPETATISWLGQMFNNPDFSILMDVSPIEPKAANKYLENMTISADGIMQTKWFKKRASDVERMKIDHIRQTTQTISESITNGQVGLKEVCFYLTFKDKTRKRLDKKLNEFREKLSSFNMGWMLTDCRCMQKDAIINTRFHDIPSLQYHKSSFSMLKSGKMSHAGATSATQSYTNGLAILPAIDHKILTTSLGISYPFFAHSLEATPKTWFKGFVEDAEATPFFNDYWKIDGDYNSFNRFYQGRNGSGKSYTTFLDLVADRLDNKFLICIDPKPERVNLTKNLGGENLNIGGSDPNDPHINMFDILITPKNEGENATANQNPLLTQYQANLLNVGILLSLSVDNPNDKVVLSCFNDVQQEVYEKQYGITPESDFVNIPKDGFPLLKDFYNETIRRFEEEKTPETKSAFNKLMVLLKEHAVGVSSQIFNFHSNVDWNKNRMWNLIVRDIALDYGNKNILACWILNLIRIAEAFMISGQEVVLYIDELHLIHNINGVLRKLDEFARLDRSFRAAVCLINQNFNSIRSGSDPRKREYYESLFTMSQYNFFFTTGEEDVMFLVEMLSGSGSPLSLAERSFITKAGRGKALLVMTAYDRYRVQFDVSFWREIWEKDLWEEYQQATASDGAAAVDPAARPINADAGNGPIGPSTPQTPPPPAPTMPIPQGVNELRSVIPGVESENVSVSAADNPLLKNAIDVNDLDKQKHDDDSDFFEDK